MLGGGAVRRAGAGQRERTACGVLGTRRLQQWHMRLPGRQVLPPFPLYLLGWLPTESSCKGHKQRWNVCELHTARSRTWCIAEGLRCLLNK